VTGKQMHKKNLLWILLYPVYQILGSIRHEGSHALAAMAEGAKITEFVFWPTFKEDGSVLWGYVKWHEQTSWFPIAAPYFCDLITFFFAYFIVAKFDIKRYWLRINIIILGMISPLVNSVYNYWGGLSGPNDVGYLFENLNIIIIHFYFGFTILLYAFGTYSCLSIKSSGKTEKTKSPRCYKKYKWFAFAVLVSLLWVLFANNTIKYPQSVNLQEQVNASRKTHAQEKVFVDKYLSPVLKRQMSFRKKYPFNDNNIAMPPLDKYRILKSKESIETHGSTIRVLLKNHYDVTFVDEDGSRGKILNFWGKASKKSKLYDKPPAPKMSKSEVIKIAKSFVTAIIGKWSDSFTFLKAEYSHASMEYPKYYEGDWSVRWAQVSKHGLPVAYEFIGVALNENTGPRLLINKAVSNFDTNVEPKINKQKALELAGTAVNDFISEIKSKLSGNKIKISYEEKNVLLKYVNPRWLEKDNQDDMQPLGFKAFLAWEVCVDMSFVEGSDNSQKPQSKGYFSFWIDALSGEYLGRRARLTGY
jgi:hypothetical protein